ncbi:MAG: Zn-ribbon domain-containing OB-fold protein [Dehalococcoidales bacterium]|nr:Zn-ribbon domain-containing OB-fold protein [Dehalococcoidales bacterium]
MKEPVLSVKEYLAALDNNRLLGLKCRKCGFITVPPRLACRRCGYYDSEVVELSGKGKIATFTSVYIPVESRRGKTPYLVVMVELEEGPWIMGNLLGIDPSTATFDLMDRRVAMVSSPVSFEKEKGEVNAPQFQLSD